VLERCGVSNSSCPHDKDQRSSRWLTQGMSDSLICLFQGCMSDGERLKVVQSTLGRLLEQRMGER